jgi:hypothetical protein
MFRVLVACAAVLSGVLAASAAQEITPSMDDMTAIVLDAGSGSVKAGFAGDGTCDRCGHSIASESLAMPDGELTVVLTAATVSATRADAPLATFQSTIGRPKDPQVMYVNTLLVHRRSCGVCRGRRAVSCCGCAGWRSGPSRCSWATRPCTNGAFRRRTILSFSFEYRQRPAPRLLAPSDGSERRAYGSLQWHASYRVSDPERCGGELGRNGEGAPSVLPDSVEVDAACVTCLVRSVQLLTHAFVSELRSAPEEHHLLMTEGTFPLFFVFFFFFFSTPLLSYPKTLACLTSKLHGAYGCVQHH